MNHYNLHAYQFDLPNNLIAQYPHDPADECKLMIIDTTTQTIQHQIFNQALSSLGSDSVFFFNNSKVIKARIPVQIGDRQGELFFLRYVGDGISEFLVRPGKKCKIGAIISIGKYQALIQAYTDCGRLIYIDGDIYDILEKYGQIPLPPYIKYEQAKSHLYQPVFANKAGSVASPTASLHFTPRLLDQLRSQGVNMEYVTLHIGIGTFKGVGVDNILDYDIHPESVEISIGLLEKIAQYHREGRRIIGIGTTVCRTLETLPYLYILICDQIETTLSTQAKKYRDTLANHCTQGTGYCINPHILGDIIYFQTKLYVTPGFKTHIIQDLITNFHLPGSSLLILVASLIGYELMIKAYQKAIDKHYHFYSFGDAMWLQKIDQNNINTL